MDEYLETLYHYILEIRRSDHLVKSKEFQTCQQEILQAWEALESVVSSEQQQALDSLFSARAQLSFFEEQWLFLEGIALGKWLARQT